MTTALLAASHFNVKATLNKAFSDAIAAFARPAWLPATIPVRFDWQDIAASVPCYAVAHLDGGAADEYQGRREAATGRVMSHRAIFEASAWVTKQSPDWGAQLETLTDYAVAWLVATPALVIQDYATDPTTPTATSYRVELEDVITAEPAPDPNPDLARRRVLISYRWMYRA